MVDVVQGIGDEVLVGVFLGTLMWIVLVKSSEKLFITPCRRGFSHISHVVEDMLTSSDTDNPVAADDAVAFDDQRPRFQGDVCPICLAEPPCLALETNCGHIFCGECLRTYWHMDLCLEAILCPLCRQRVRMLFQCFSQSDATSELLANERTLVVSMRAMYNQRNSGLPRTWQSYLEECPILIRHLWREFFSEDGLEFMFRMRIVMCFISGMTYLLSPLDIIPEAIFGILGLMDDICVLFLLVIHTSILYRRMLLQRA